MRSNVFNQFRQDCYGNAGEKEICGEFSETLCNTTYDDQWKPQTSCERHPKEICAPDSCQVVPVSLSYAVKLELNLYPRGRRSA